ncbi:hypothetical protein ACWCQP_45085 [Streptomyces chartreusis]
MSAVVTTERTAKPRVRRTRSRGRNELEPLRVSTMAVHEYDLDPACVSLVCPSCRTWVPISRPNGQPGRTRLVPHHTEKAGTTDPVSCKGGSHRRVIIDVEAEWWQQRRSEGVPETDGRRSTRVTRKPKVAVTPAVAQIVAPMLSAEDTLKQFRIHARQCPVCQESGHEHCPEGSPLVRVYLYKLRNASAIYAGLAAKAREEDEKGDRGQWLLRARQWAATAGSVRRADLQRVQDALEATLRQHNQKLNDWQRADLMSAITLLATKAEQLSR